MRGWFPHEQDGGIAPNPEDPSNPPSAFAPTIPPLMQPALYYSSDCNARLRPHVLNTLISENQSVVDSVGLAYNSNSLINLRTAIEYIKQKGIPSFTVLEAQGVPTNYYRGELTPPLHGGYNNGMTLVVVPNQTNQGFVRIDLGGGWWVPVLRNDHGELESEDWPANVPQIISYYNGAFFLLGIAKSQVPIVLKGAIAFWIRPDGDDITGDGSENTPERAFRTIDGAWEAVGARFSASPNSHIALRLGVPGEYDGGTVGPYGSSLSIIGDPNDPASYRVHAKDYGGHSQCIGATGVTSFFLEGVTCVMDFVTPTPYGNRGIAITRSAAHFNNIDILLGMDHPFSSMMLTVETSSSLDEAAAYIPDPSSTIRFVGNGNSCEYVIWFASQVSMNDHTPDFFTPPVWYFENINIRSAGVLLSTFSSISNATRIWVQSGCTGRQFVVTDLSTFRGGGRGVPPGDQPGFVGPMSVFEA